MLKQGSYFVLDQFLLQIWSLCTQTKWVWIRATAVQRHISLKWWKFTQEHLMSDSEQPLAPPLYTIWDSLLPALQVRYWHPINVSNVLISEIHKKVSSREVVRGSISAVCLNSSKAEDTEKKPCCRNIWSHRPPGRVGLRSRGQHPPKQDEGGIRQEAQKGNLCCQRVVDWWPFKTSWCNQKPSSGFIKLCSLLKVKNQNTNLLRQDP